MSPVFDKVYDEAVKPYIDETLTIEQAFYTGKEPIKAFMLAQTRVTDIGTFINISGYKNIKSPEEAPMSVIIPAFITSELKTAFQIGFMLFVPF